MIAFPSLPSLIKSQVNEVLDKGREVSKQTDQHTSYIVALKKLGLEWSLQSESTQPSKPQRARSKSKIICISKEATNTQQGKRETSIRFRKAQEHYRLEREEEARHASMYNRSRASRKLEERARSINQNNKRRKRKKKTSGTDDKRHCVINKTKSQSNRSKKRKKTKQIRKVTTRRNRKKSGTINMGSTTVEIGEFSVGTSSEGGVNSNRSIQLTLHHKEAAHIDLHSANFRKGVE